MALNPLSPSLAPIQAHQQAAAALGGRRQEELTDYFRASRWHHREYGSPDGPTFKVAVRFAVPVPNVDLELCPRRVEAASLPISTEVKMLAARRTLARRLPPWRR